LIPRPVAWGFKETTEFVDTVLNQTEAKVKFTDEAVKAVVGIAAGSPRITIRNLYQIYSNTIISQRKSKVTKDDVRRVARGVHEIRSAEGLKSDIETVLAAKQIPFEIDCIVTPSGGDEILVDFQAVPVKGRVLNIKITKSLFEKRDTKEIIPLAESATRDGEDTTNFFVVNGFVTNQVKNTIKSAGQNKIIYVRSSYFEEDFLEAVDAYLEAYTREQQYSNVEQITLNLNTMVSRVHHSLRQNERSLQTLEVRMAQHGSKESKLYPLVLPDNCLELINLALRPIRLYTSLTREIYLSFQIADDDTGFSVGKRYRYEMVDQFNRDHILSRFLGCSQTVIWIMEGFAEQIARIELEASNRRGKSRSRSRKLMITRAQELVQEPIAYLVEWEQDVRVLFENSIMMSESTSSGDLLSTNYSYEFRGTRIDHERVRALPYEIVAQLR